MSLPDIRRGRHPIQPDNEMRFAPYDPGVVSTAARQVSVGTRPERPSAELKAWAAREWTLVLQADRLAVKELRDDLATPNGHPAKAREHHERLWAQEEFLRRWRLAFGARTLSLISVSVPRRHEGTAIAAPVPPSALRGQAPTH